jgi:hypothetical protein
MNTYSSSPDLEDKASQDADTSQTLPLLMLAPPPKLQLPDTQSVLFSTALFSRTLLDGHPRKIHYACLHLGCNYSPPAQMLSQTSTSNLWTHLQRHHISIYNSVKRPVSATPSVSSTQSSTASFFQPHTHGAKQGAKFRELLLDFICSNNLALRLVESDSFRAMVRFLNSTTILISKTTLGQDLHKTFAIGRHDLEIELQRHVQAGGRLSLTTDAWSARNYSEYSAVTVHWINNKWQQNSRLLDVADQLFTVTESYSITSAVFTVTRDNASNNTTMLSSFEERSLVKPKTIIQPWRFLVKEGDVSKTHFIVSFIVIIVLIVIRSGVLHISSTLLFS